MKKVYVLRSMISRPNDPWYQRWYQIGIFRKKTTAKAFARLDCSDSHDHPITVVWHKHDPGELRGEVMGGKVTYRIERHPVQ